jgi:hypothetical protein
LCLVFACVSVLLASGRDDALLKRVERETETMQTQTDTATRTKPAKPASVGLFTKADLDYLRRLTARMVAIDAWESAKRFTAREGDLVSDAWLITPWGGDYGSPPEIARECDGAYTLYDGNLNLLAKGKTIQAVTKRFARALAV